MTAQGDARIWTAELLSLVFIAPTEVFAILLTSSVNFDHFNDDAKSKEARNHPVLAEGLLYKYFKIINLINMIFILNFVFTVMFYT
jgi:hypothetical protein